MSFAIRHSVSKTILLGQLADSLPGRFQAALNATAKAGLDFLREPGRIPVDKRYLIDSTRSGNNQFSVYFAVDSAPPRPDAKGALYGIYQNQGYHARSGAWVEGHHFMEEVEDFAVEYLTAQIGAILGSAPLSGSSFRGQAGTSVRARLAARSAGIDRRQRVVSGLIRRGQTGPNFSGFFMRPAHTRPYK